jgi:hypothetical protein
MPNPSLVPLPTRFLPILRHTESTSSRSLICQVTVAIAKIAAKSGIVHCLGSFLAWEMNPSGHWLAYRLIQERPGENGDPRGDGRSSPRASQRTPARLPTFVITKQRGDKTLVTLDQSILFQHDSSRAIAASKWCQMDETAATH